MSSKKRIADTKARVLVVDDSRVMRKAISKILSGDFDLVEAEDGEIGWETLVKDNRIRVVIADVQMPRLDGYSMICRIRAADETRVRDVPIIVSTGADDEVTRERAFACGANDFITKPIDAAQLVSRIHSYLDIEQNTSSSDASSSKERETSVDPLTQLSSRRSFMDHGAADLADAKQHDDDLALVRLDVDHFEKIRSEYGDEIADQLLIWLAKTLLYKTRNDLSVARTGSAKFAVLAASMGRMEAAVLCERLRSAVAESPFTHEAISIPVTISIGLVTIARNPVSSIEEMYSMAEQRLQVAKATGGNRLVASDHEGDKKIDEAIMEEPDIDTALAMLAGNEAGKLGPYAPSLALRVIPLLEFCNETLGLELEYEINSLKERLYSLY